MDYAVEENQVGLGGSGGESCGSEKADEVATGEVHGG
jgi:hypothetical protein